MIGEDVVERLYNWKFNQALDALDESAATPHEKGAIKALAEAFGNVGYFDGVLARVVQVAVHDLIGDVE